MAIAVVLVLFASAAAGHAVHTHNDGGSAAGSVSLQVERNVDELVQQYSLFGNDSLLQEAQRQLPPADELRTVPQLLQATWVAQADHAFVRARELIERIIVLQPKNGQAWLLEAAIANVVGDVPSARRACGKVLMSVSPDVSMICFASLAGTQQQKRAAHARLGSMPFSPVKSRLAAWRFSVQGELARDLGRVQEAEVLLLRAIAIFPAVQTRSVLIDLLLQQERYSAAFELGAEHATVPAIAIRRVLAQQGLGEDITDEVKQLNARFAGWLKVKDYRHAREMAMFYLDIEPRARIAFHVATENAKLQREAEDMVLLDRASEFYLLEVSI